MSLSWRTLILRIVAFLIGAGCVTVGVLLASFLLRRGVSLGPPAEGRRQTEMAAA